MKKFLALYMMPTDKLDEMMKNSTPDQMKKGMEDWKKWMATKGSAFADMGAPAGKNKRVTASGVADARNEVTGYSVITADSHAAATEVVKDSPHLTMPGAYIEILDLLAMAGI